MEGQGRCQNRGGPREAEPPIESATKRVSPGSSSMMFASCPWEVVEAPPRFGTTPPSKPFRG
eukprot:6227347-Alexandrium_andersonii.AAC.1